MSEIIVEKQEMSCRRIFYCRSGVMLFDLLCARENLLPRLLLFVTVAFDNQH